MTETPRSTLPLHDEGNGQEPERLLSRMMVLDRVPLSNDEIWRLQQQGQFPRGRVVGGRTMWFESEITAWLSSLPPRKLKGDKDGIAGPAHLRSEIHPRRKRLRLSAGRAAELEAQSGVEVDEGRT